MVFKKQFLFWVIILAGCGSSKEVVQAPVAVKPLPPAPKIYSCGFTTSRFEGKLPCYGNDCGENGNPTTRLDFHDDKTLVRTMITDHGTLTTPGTWEIDKNCLITVNYAVKTIPEYYQLKNEALVKLTNAKTEYSGVFADSYILLKK